MLGASDAVVAAIGAAPIAFVVGLLVGWRLGSRWELRRRG
jgi:hypothetical protein